MAQPRVAMPVAQPVVKSSPSSSSSSSHHASKGSDDMIDAQLILDMPHTKAYKLVEGSKRLVEDGKLEVLCSLLVESHAAHAPAPASAAAASSAVVPSTASSPNEVYIIVLGSVKLALRQHVPCLEMAPRNFVFPTDGATYGIVVAESVDDESAITDDVLDVFRILLTDHTSFRSAAVPQLITALPDRPDRVVSTAHSVAAGLGAGSVVVATGVIKGGKLVGEMITKGGAYLTSRLKPNAEPSKISEERKSRVKKAKFLSSAACKVSKALVIGAMATTDLMSKQISEALKETEVGKKLAHDPEHPNERLEAAKLVGKSTIGAVLHVYQAIETAVFGVANDAATATVTVVTHKYGQEAGHHASESLGVVENVALAGYQVKKLGVKSLARSTVIKSGQEILTTDAERAEAARIAEEKEAKEGPSIGSALGLPAGIDPLVAVEAMQAAAVLHQAAAPHLAASAAHPNDSTRITTAVATGPTQAAAQANAQSAANAAAHK